MGYDAPSQTNLVVENSVEIFEERKKEGKGQRKKEMRKEEMKGVGLHF